MKLSVFTLTKRKNLQFIKLILEQKRRVERNIEIIGEAINIILKKEDTISISNSRKLVDFRNRMIHGYNRVSVEIIWGVVIIYLPILQNEIELLLEE